MLESTLASGYQRLIPYYSEEKLCEIKTKCKSQITPYGIPLPGRLPIPGIPLSRPRLAGAAPPSIGTLFIPFVKSSSASSKYNGRSSTISIVVPFASIASGPRDRRTPTIPAAAPAAAPMPAPSPGRPPRRPPLSRSMFP